MVISTFFLGFYDLVFTPFCLFICIFALFFISKRIKDKLEAKLFFYGITVKIISAILFGVIYDFFYGGGDTSAYWLYGTYIGDALKDSPIKWIKLLLYVKNDPSIYMYTTKIRWYLIDPSSYFACRIVGFLAPFCFNIYSIIAMFYAMINFSGLWVLFKTLKKSYSELTLELAFAIFFIPSIVFWGSGIMKDGVSLSALGWLFYGVHELFIRRKFTVKNIFIIIIASWVVLIVKVYIFMCFVPSVCIWIFLHYQKNIKSAFLQVFLKPVLIGFFAIIAIMAIRLISQNYKQYSLEHIEETAKVTREYIAYVSERGGGSTYDLGEISSSPWDLLQKAPFAINVSLFRPYLWESKNVFMLLAAVESLFMLYLTLYVLFKGGISQRLMIKEIRADSFLVFCFVFSLVFAFAIGISTNNFGTLMRYKIPIIPFYMIALFIIRKRILNHLERKQSVRNF